MGSASLAGLSVRMRLMRGKRIASPDLWRLLVMDRIESDFEDQALGDLPHRAETLDGVAATKRSSHFNSSSVKPK